MYNYLQLDKFEEMIFEYNAFKITFDIEWCRITFRIPKKKSNDLVEVDVVLLSCNGTIVCLEYNNCFNRFELDVVSTRKCELAIFD